VRVGWLLGGCWWGSGRGWFGDGFMLGGFRVGVGFVLG